MRLSSLHQKIPAGDIHQKMLMMLKQVRLDAAEEILEKLPFQLSGGQCQRVMIAMALVHRPKLLIADEPTTALDVNLQAEILNLLLSLKKEIGMACLFITHNLDIMRNIAERIAVIDQGKIIEQGKAFDILQNPKTKLTKSLLAAIPQPLNQTLPADAEAAKPILTVKDFYIHYPKPTALWDRIRQNPQNSFTACDNINFTLKPSETLGIVGQSGCGKSSLARGLMRLIQGDGIVRFDNHDLMTLSPKQLRPLRQNFQIIFQNPLASLNPKMQIGDIVAEGLDIFKLTQSKSERTEKIIHALSEVNLAPDMQSYFPYQLSGGQCQRVAIARTSALKPKIMILDEPTSSLDAGNQAQIIALLKELQAKHRMSYLFISHDIKLVRSLAHHVMVMHQGKIIEYEATESLFQNPQKAETQKLIDAAYLKFAR